jgi:autotransporter-associated beta strand protein
MNQTLSGEIGGKGTFVKDGTGTLTLSGSFNMGSVELRGGEMVIATMAPATTSGNFTVDDTTTLSLDLSNAPAVQAGGVFAIGNGATLGITGYSGKEGSGPLTLVTADGGVGNGRFAALELDGTPYDTKSIDIFLDPSLRYNANDIQLAMGLAWNRTDDAHGTFNTKTPYTLREALVDKDPNTTVGGWDGKTLTKKGNNTLIVLSNNTYTGQTIIEQGTLQLGDPTINDGTSGSIKGGVEIQQDGRLVFNRSDDPKYGGAMSGNGAVIKMGDADLTLSGASSGFSGNMDILGGRLVVGNDDALGFRSTVNMRAGTSLRFAGDYSLGNDFVLNGTTDFDTAGHNGTVLGGISETATSGLRKTGEGTLYLDGANTYTGPTEVERGILALRWGGEIDSRTLILHDGTGFDESASRASRSSGLDMLSVYGSASYEGDLNITGGTMNFFVPGSKASDSVLLDVTGLAEIDGSEVFVGFPGGSTILRPGDTLVLIDSDQDLVGTQATTTTDGSGMQGVALRYSFDILIDPNDPSRLLATAAKVSVNEQLKALSEGFLAGLILNLRGADLVGGQGMEAAVSAAREGMERGVGWNSFATVSGGLLRHNTGSYVDMQSVSLMTGLSFGADLTPGRMTLGAFFEFGNGSYDTHNSFSGAASVDGDGDTWYMGGGVLGHMAFNNIGPGHIYTEASARIGKIHNDYNSSDLRDANGRRADFDTGSPYYSLHAGLGYLWQLNERASMDLHAKYFWTRMEGDSVQLHTGDRIRFKHVDSHRVRLGGRFAFQANDFLRPYVGAAYEHEFDGKSRAWAGGYPIDEPDLKGDTGIGELGVSYRPGADVPVFFDLGVQGYAGQRQGVAGSLQLKWQF